MNKVTYKEFEFDIDQLIAKDKQGKLTILETIDPHIILEGLNHEEIIKVFEEVKASALKLGFDNYKILEEIEDYTDYPILVAVSERPEKDVEYFDRLIKTEYKKKKGRIAYQEKKKKQQLENFKKFYDDQC
jgi:hypothetical protein